MGQPRPKIELSSYIGLNTLIVNFLPPTSMTSLVFLSVWKHKTTVKLATVLPGGEDNFRWGVEIWV